MEKFAGICAWCRRRKDHDGQPYGDRIKDNMKFRAFQTHGICEPCKENQLAELHQDHKMPKATRGEST